MCTCSIGKLVVAGFYALLIAVREQERLHTDAITIITSMIPILGLHHLPFGIVTLEAASS